MTPVCSTPATPAPVSNSFGQVLDPQFLYLYFNESLPEGPWDCFTDGYCGLGGMTDVFGTVQAADSFLFVSTANFTDQGSGNVVVVVSSGVFTKNLTVTNPTQLDSLRVSFEWSFLTSRLASATHNDSIVVRARTTSDSTRLFKVTTADLETGRYPVKAGGCGTRAIIVGENPIDYAHCTDWALATADLTPFLNRTFALEFIVSEGSQDLNDQVDQPSVFLFRALKIEGGR